MYINSKKWSYKISKIEILQAVVNEAFQDNQKQINK